MYEQLPQEERAETNMAQYVAKLILELDLEWYKGDSKEQAISNAQERVRELARAHRVYVILESKFPAQQWDSTVGRISHKAALALHTKIGTVQQRGCHKPQAADWTDDQLKAFWLDMVNRHSDTAGMISLKTVKAGIAQRSTQSATDEEAPHTPTRARTGRSINYREQLAPVARSTGKKRSAAAVREPKQRAKRTCRGPPAGEQQEEEPEQQSQEQQRLAAEQQALAEQQATLQQLQQKVAGEQAALQQLQQKVAAQRQALQQQAREAQQAQKAAEQELATERRAKQQLETTVKQLQEQLKASQQKPQQRRGPQQLQQMANSMRDAYGAMAASYSDQVAATKHLPTQEARLKKLSEIIIALATAVGWKAVGDQQKYLLEVQSCAFESAVVEASSVVTYAQHVCDGLKAVCKRFGMESEHPLPKLLRETLQGALSSIQG